MIRTHQHHPLSMTASSSNPSATALGKIDAESSEQPQKPPANPYSQVKIDHIALTGRAVLAPMSGVTDYPFRKLAHQWGAPLVVSEMVASKSLMQDHQDTQRRMIGEHLRPFVVQLAGREAYWMGEAARLSEQMGADIIDINMGCPAKQVTKGLSGSALMQNLDHALTLIEAVVAAVKLPVTLKMRLGWDKNSINAPTLAQRAEAAGVAAFTVHGRTRQQFYKGTANWREVKAVCQATNKSVFVNGDIKTLKDAKTALAESTADAVMIGRGAYGAPWKPALIANQLAGGDTSSPTVTQMAETINTHYELMLSHYGREFGVKSARKHLGWYVETLESCPTQQKVWRQKLCTAEAPQDVQNTLQEFFKIKADNAQ